MTCRFRGSARIASSVWLAALTFLALLFSSTAEVVLGSNRVGYLDEALLLMLVLRALLLPGPLRRLPATIPLVLLVAMGAVSAVIAGVPTATVAIGMLWFIKPWLYAFALAQFAWSSARIKGAIKFGAAVYAVCLFGMFANVMAHDSWTALLGAAGYSSTRYGLSAPQGLFSSQLVAGNVMAAGALCVLAHAWVYGPTWWHRILLVGGAVSAFITGRRTAVLGGILGVTAARLRISPASTWLTWIVLAPIVVAAAWGTLTSVAAETNQQYVENASSAPRTILHRDMFGVAGDHFPFGAGFGRFGSFMASVDYSPEYQERGYQFIWGLSAWVGNDDFLMDTQWPAVVGETGYAGALFAVLAVMAIARRFVSASGSERPDLRFLGTAGLANLVLLAIASIGLPVFFGSSPPQVAMFAILGISVGTLSAPPSTDENGANSSRMVRSATGDSSAARENGGSACPCFRL